MQLSIFSSAEPPARTSASPDCEREWLESAATSRLSFLDWLNACGRGGWFGRTSPACIAPLPTSLPIRVSRETTFTKASQPGTKKWLRTNTTQSKAMRSPASWPDFKNSGMGSPTELWTLNTLEFHSGAAASSLSDILETGDVPQRFYLSATACRGILRRAEKRGKALPMTLRRALEQVAGASSEPATPEGRMPLSP